MKKSSSVRRRNSFAFLVFSLVLGLLIVFLGINLLPQKAQEEEKQDNTPSVVFAESDAITAEIRNKANNFARVDVKSLDDRGAIAKYGKIVEDYGSFVVLATRSKTALPTKFDAQPLETSINLPSGKFEPLKKARPESITANNSLEGSGEKGYYIVQFGSTVRDEWLDDLRASGLEILQYVPHQAFFVYGDDATIAKAAGHARVRWVGRYTPQQKFPPELEKFTANVGADTAMFDVAVFANADLAQIGREFTSLTGGRVLHEIKLPNNFFNVLRVEMPTGDVAKTAAISAVFRIDPYTRPVIEDERAAQIVAGNYSSPTVILPPGYNPLTQFGVDGSGVTVSVADDGISIPGNGGFYITAANTVDGPLRGATPGASGGHGHINASIIAGSLPFGALDPLGYNYGVGVAPKANIINIPFLKSGNTTTDVQMVDDTVNTVGPNGVKGSISNNSWGNGTNGNSYDSYAAQFDGFVQDASLAATIDPISLVFSAGNSGPGPLSLTRPKVAKNVIAVANSENIRTEIGGAGADNLDDLRSSSSRGPAADGRVKPDVTAPGTVISGSRAGSGGSVSGQIDANHSWSTGTSHAAPQVAGAAALFTEYWKDTHAGINPSPALIKAAIINTAQEMNGNITNTSTVPNGNEGWGRINMKYMLNTGVSTKYVNQEFTFSNAGVGIGFLGEVADSTKPVRISLVWTDPPGAGDPALVNNLDLVVNIGGTVYKGNVFSGGNSTSGGAADTINNVENVFLPAGIPAGTSFGISVSSAAINGDGILGNGDPTDQHFSLVGYNFDELAPDQSQVSDFDGDGRSDVAVWRPSSGVWYSANSSNGNVLINAFGQAGDQIAPGDYDGDGRTDYAIFREGLWYILRSAQGFTAAAFGAAGDLPVPADYDGDNKTDLAVWRPSTGVWYLLRSTAGFSAVAFGQNGDRLVPGDYDGDDKADVGIFRDGTWYLLQSTAGFSAVSFGSGGDKVVPQDYDGDDKTDIAVFRESNGTWYLLRSQLGLTTVGFGTTGDIPAVGDFDGDFKADVSIFRPATGSWYRQNSSNGAGFVTAFGTSGDEPVPAAYVPVQ